MLGSQDARSLHCAHPAIDLHADTLMWARWVGYDLARRHTPPFPHAAVCGHVDIPRLREGGIGAQFFGLVSLPIFSRHNLGRVIHAQIDALDKVISAHPDTLSLARTADDIDRARSRGAISALLGIEGAHALDGDLANVERFAERGVRYLGLLHFSSNEAGHPAFGRGRNDAEGLSEWGRDLVRRCEANSVIVDLAHINRRGFLDACFMAKKPTIVSHTGVLGAFEHWRNIDDDQLRAVVETGGCVGVMFCPKYLGGDGLEPVVRHLKHIISVCGEDAPALGSDWDGFIVPTRELRDARGLPLLTDALLDAGISERVIAKLLRGNALRVLREA